MSYWTTINGSIRFDAIPCVDDPIKPMRTDFGNTCNFGDSDEVWDKCNVPCGSEGSLHYKLVSYDEKDCITNSTLVIWGDLRDFEVSDHHEIIEWLTRITDDDELMIRSGVIQLNDRVFVYRDDSLGEYGTWEEMRP